ncbi:MAG: chemotaxis protein CheB [Sulfuricaulis sp.]
MQSDNILPVVGIGASAGGLEALENFFAHVPADSGIAWVVIQHLDPNHKGILPELLQRSTSMEVAQIKNRTKIKPNHVYVIPPNADLSILHGALHLLEPAAPRGLRLPIDHFFRSMADDLHENAIGVVLSGMGSDGTLGLRAIKENAGLTLAQEPTGAKFDSMPRSAIDAGQADIVAAAEALPGRIIDFLKRVPGLISPKQAMENKIQSGLEKVVILLRERSGNDFSVYKKNTLYRRIERRMGLHQIDSITNYIRHLRENPQELDLLFKELLIGVTNFFRDAAVWEYLKTKVIPALLEAYPAGKSLRAWVPACSTGEEAYSLAIIFKEVIDQIKPKGRFTLQIFATDLDQDAINKARQGAYPLNIEADVTPERLTRYFAATEKGYLANKEIREMVIFAPQNIITDPPFTRMDIISCRNLLIYLGQEAQKKILPLFHYALSSRGILLLGTSETVASFSYLFTPLDNKLRLYRRIDNPVPMAIVDFPTKFFIAPSYGPEDQEVPAPVDLQHVVEQFLLQNYAPAAVLVNDAGDILYISGHTGKYLEPAAGKANWNIYSMARDGLRQALTGVVNRARRQPLAVRLEDVKIGTSSGTQTVNVIVQAIDKPPALNGRVLLVFWDVATPSVGKKTRKNAASTAHKTLEAALQRAREELQALRDEMQSSQEELKSANEELQSTNEELQSTNEELTTSKEEMQSLNEELQTVNAELQSKVDDLSHVNNDMSNLLNSTEIATIFLDAKLHVRRFTTHATHLFKLIQGDVGRPLSDVVSTLNYPQLQEDAQEVLRTLVFSDKLIHTHDARMFKVRIMPYRTVDNRIDGVVITFTNITEPKT